MPRPDDSPTLICQNERNKDQKREIPHPQAGETHGSDRLAAGKIGGHRSSPVRVAKTVKMRLKPMMMRGTWIM